MRAAGAGRGGIARLAPLALSLKVAGAGFNFGATVLLARLAGARGAGIYFLGFTVVSVAALIGRLGLDGAGMRFVATAVDRGRSPEGIRRMAARLSCIASVSAAVVTLVIAPMIAGSIFDQSDLTGPLRAMALGIPGLALAFVYGGLLKGAGQTLTGIASESVVAPLVTVIMFAVLIPSHGPLGAGLAFAIGAWTAAGAAVRWWGAVERGGEPDPLSRAELLATSRPLLWIAAMNLVMQMADVFMVGIWLDERSVGVYATALRTAMLATLVLLAMGSVVAPRFAQLHARGRLDELARLARRAAAMMTATVLPLLVPMMIFPERVMAVFGAGFVEEGARALAIVAAGQLVNVATGPVGYLLTMTGHHGAMRRVTAIFAGVFVLMNSLLIPPFGVTGAAVAFAISLTLLNLSLLWLVRQRLGILVVPFPAREPVHA